MESRCKVEGGIWDQRSALPPTFRTSRTARSRESRCKVKGGVRVHVAVDVQGGVTVKVDVKDVRDVDGLTPTV
jgi:hypothetical protein